MYFKKVCMLFLFVALVGAVLGLAQEYIEEELDSVSACTVFAAGKDATVDGSVITYMTADTQGAEMTWYYEPAVDHEEGEMRKIYIIRQTQKFPPDYTRPIDEESTFSGVEIPQVSHTNGYLHSLHFHMNDKQVQMNESTIGGRRELRNPNAIMDICNLSNIALERASTAREAIQIMGALAEEWGYSRTDSGECLAVADKNEAWIFVIYGVGPLWVPGESEGPGAVWAAQRVPDDHVAFVGNNSIIREIDFDDSENFMYSSNVVDLAVERGWYDPQSGESFDMNVYDPRVWSNGEPITPANSRGYYGRQWRGFNLVAPSQELSIDTPMNEFPFSVKVDKKLSLQDVFAIDRDHFEGSELDMVDEFAAGPFGLPNRYPRSTRIDMDGDGEKERYYFGRPLQPFHTEYTSICQSRAWLPDEIGGILWLGLGEADSTCFMPFYCGITELPESFGIGHHWEFNRESARWAFEYVDYVMLPFYQAVLPYVEAAQLRHESSEMAEIAAVDAFALDLYDESRPQKVQAYLTDYCVDNANQIVDEWWELGDTLIMYFAHGYDYTTPGRKGSLSAPEWYLRGIIELDQLKPAP